MSRVRGQGCRDKGMASREGGEAAAQRLLGLHRRCGRKQREAAERERVPCLLVVLPDTVSAGRLRILGQESPTADVSLLGTPARRSPSFVPRRRRCQCGPGVEYDLSSHALGSPPTAVPWVKARSLLDCPPTALPLPWNKGRSLLGKELPPTAGDLPRSSVRQRLDHHCCAPCPRRVAGMFSLNPHTTTTTTTYQ